MLPPGLSFNSDQREGAGGVAACDAARSRTGRGSRCSSSNAQGFFTYTPSTNLLFGLRDALRMLREEGLEQVFARHQRLAAATRAAVRAWELEILCRREDERSAVVTTVMMPDGARRRRVPPDRARSIRICRSAPASAGSRDARFRIGHLGDFNELMLMGTLCGVEMALSLSGVPHPEKAACSPRWTPLSDRRTTAALSRETPRPRF